MEGQTCYARHTLYDRKTRKQIDEWFEPTDKAPDIKRAADALVRSMRSEGIIR